MKTILFKIMPMILLIIGFAFAYTTRPLIEAQETYRGNIESICWLEQEDQLVVTRAMSPDGLIEIHDIELETVSTIRVGGVRIFPLIFDCRTTVSNELFLNIRDINQLPTTSRLQVFNVQNQSLSETELTLSLYNIYFAQLSPSSNLLAVYGLARRDDNPLMGEFQRLQIFDVVSNTFIGELDVGTIHVFDIKWVTNSTIKIASDAGVYTYNIPSFQQSNSSTLPVPTGGDISSGVLSNDMLKVAYFEEDGDEAYLNAYDLDTNTLLWTQPVDTNTTNFAGKSLLWSPDDTYVIHESNQSIEFYSTQTGEIAATIPIEAERSAYALHISPNGTQVAFAVFDQLYVVSALPRTAESVQIVAVTEQSIELQWISNMTTNHITYIERQVDDGEWIELGTVNEDIGRYIDESIVCGNRYAYRIRALRNENPRLFSVYSDTVARS